jgi:hypothetical protein
MWALMAISCVVFAVTAAEFYWVVTTGGTATYATVLSWAVSEEFAFGPGSGAAEMAPYWSNMPAFNQVVLGAHAVLASMALAIGPFQFLAVVRRRWPRMHMLAGRLYAVLALVSMMLAVVYLSVTPMDKIYGGAPFAIGLWGIAFLTTYTLVGAVVHVIRGEVVAHRTTMALNFAAMLIAPLLRFWWMFLGWLFRDFGIDQATAHTAVLMFLGLQVVVGAIVVLHFQSASLSGPSQPLMLRVRTAFSTHRRRWLGAMWGLGIVAVLAVIAPLSPSFRDPALWLRDLEVYNSHGLFFWLRIAGMMGVCVSAPLFVGGLFQDGEVTLKGAGAFFLAVFLTVTGWLGLAQGYGLNGVGGLGGSVYHLTLAVAAGVFALLWAHARRNNNRRQLKEMTLHLFALCMTPATQSVAMGLFLVGGFNWEEAFLSGAVLAPTVNLSMSFYYTVYGGREALLRVGQEPAALF